MPGFTKLFSSSGTLTNQVSTSIYGVVSEQGTLEINHEPVRVQSDGSFRMLVGLEEGRNSIPIEFTDKAGNMINRTMEVERDTAMPSIELGDIPTLVNERQLNLSIISDSNSLVRVNGYSASTSDTRQESGIFLYTVTLSPGINTIVVSSTDQAGNTAQDTFMVEYQPEVEDTTVNYAAIGMMIALLVVGLVLGLFLGPMLLGGKKEELPEEEVPPDGDSEIRPEKEEIAPLPEEELTPLEDSSPDEPAGAVESPPKDEIPAEDISEPKPDEPQPAEANIPDEPSAEPSPSGQSSPEEDPRIVKLREAYEAGKMSKELYEKNLKRFQG